MMKLAVASCHVFVVWCRVVVKSNAQSLGSVPSRSALFSLYYICTPVYL